MVLGQSERNSKQSLMIIQQGWARVGFQLGGHKTEFILVFFIVLFICITTINYFCPHCMLLIPNCSWSLRNGPMSPSCCKYVQPSSPKLPSSRSLIADGRCCGVPPRAPLQARDARFLCCRECGELMAHCQRQPPGLRSGPFLVILKVTKTLFRGVTTLKGFSSSRASCGMDGLRPVTSLWINRSFHYLLSSLPPPWTLIPKHPQ